MLAELKAVGAFLAPLNYPWFLVWADSPPAQYVVLTGKGWDNPDQMPLCDTSQSIDTEIRVKAVTGTTDGVFIMLNAIRNLLSPDSVETRIPLAGRTVAVRFIRSEFVDVDQDATITGTNRHPALGVDTYRLTSQPV